MKIIKQNLKSGELPPKLEVTFTPTHIKIGLRSFPPYIDVKFLFFKNKEDLPNKIKSSESMWLIDGEEITITLIKAIKVEFIF